MRLVTAELIHIQPLGTPNYVNLNLYYTDEMLDGTPDWMLRLFYYHEGLHRWIEVPKNHNSEEQFVWTDNVDVSALANELHWVALFA